MKKAVRGIYRHAKFVFAFIIAMVLFTGIVYAGDVIFKAGDFNVTGEAVIGENLNMNGNVTMGNKITFGLGEIIDNIADGWIKITGNEQISAEDAALKITDTEYNKYLQFQVLNGVPIISTDTPTGTIWFGYLNISAGGYFVGSKGLIDVSDGTNYFEACSAGTYATDINSAGTLTCSVISAATDTHVTIPHKVFAYNTTSGAYYISLTSWVDSQITTFWVTEDYDTGGDNSNGVFTCPHNGYYLVNYQVYASDVASGGGFGCSVYINGVKTFTGGGAYTAGNWMGCNCGGVQYCGSGQQIKFYVASSDTSIALRGGKENSNYQVTMLSAS